MKGKLTQQRSLLPSTKFAKIKLALLVTQHPTCSNGTSSDHGDMNNLIPYPNSLQIFPSSYPNSIAQPHYPCRQPVELVATQPKQWQTIQHTCS
jgi:hypothetical protein